MNMRPITQEEERLLLDHCQATGVLINQTIPEGIQFDTAKLHKVLAGTRFDEDGRVHPFYARSRTGRILSRPALETFPWEMLAAPEGHALLDLNEWSMEPLFFAKAVGQMDLCRELVQGKRIGDVLKDRLGLDKRGRQVAKQAFFWHVYGVAKSHEEHTEVRDMVSRILETYPNLSQITSDLRLRQMATVNLNIATFWLNIARSAHNHPNCRLVGFWHMEPLVECIEADAETLTKELVGMGSTSLKEMAA